MKLMIVDDEPDICEGIRAGIDWNTLGISKALTATDAFQALSIFKREHPEIVISDISMPRMSGIELIEKLKEIDPYVQCILLSGYSEFEYAKNAIRLGVTSYELKPIKVSHLTELISQVILKIERENQKAHAVKLNPYTDAQYFIKKLVRSKGLLPPEEYSRGLVSLDLTADDSIFCLSLLTDRYSRNQELLFEDQAYMQTLIDLCDKWFGHQRSHIVKLGRQILLLLSSGKTAKTNIPHFFHALNQAADSRCGLTLSMGVSAENRMKDFFQAYCQSCAALRNKLYTGRASLLYFRDESALSLQGDQYAPDPELHRNIAHCYSNSRPEEALGLIHEKFCEIDRLRNYSSDDVIHFCTDLIHLLFQMDLDFKADFSSERKEAADGLQESCDTLREYEEYINDLYRRFYTKIKIREIPTRNQIVHRTIEYVKNHYAEDLSVEELALKMNVTPNYLSHLFNKEMQLSFRDFLNQYRIRQAKWYLDNTNSKAYEIASLVGFREYKYFAQIFKKYEGCSTLQYRNRRNSG